VIGMPPLSGFIGKVWLLRATFESEHGAIFWALYLLASLALLVGISKAGSTVFWHHQNKAQDTSEPVKAHKYQISALLIVLLGSPLMVIFAGNMADYAIEAAKQLHNFSGNISVVLGEGK
jgi:multicomponent K+:H+ antiporter subunit D